MEVPPLMTRKASSCSCAVIRMTICGLIGLALGGGVAAFAIIFVVPFEPEVGFERLFLLVASIALFVGALPFGCGVGMLVGATEVFRNSGQFPK